MVNIIDTNFKWLCRVQLGPTGKTNINTFLKIWGNHCFDFITVHHQSWGSLGEPLSQERGERSPYKTSKFWLRLKKTTPEFTSVRFLSLSLLPGWSFYWARWDRWNAACTYFYCLKEYLQIKTRYGTEDFFCYFANNLFNFEIIYMISGKAIFSFHHCPRHSKVPNSSYIHVNDKIKR